MTRTATIVGLILLLLGVLWLFQGIGAVGGSFMTGQTEWIVIGALTALAGAALMMWANLRKRRKS